MRSQINYPSIDKTNVRNKQDKITPPTIPSYSQFLTHYIKSFLLSRTGYCIERPNNIICRCPYCGDSSKHHNKGHLYIAKDKPVFHCVRCDSSGHISRLLIDLDIISDPNLFNVFRSVISHTKKDTYSFDKDNRLSEIKKTNRKHLYKIKKCSNAILDYAIDKYIKQKYTIYNFDYKLRYVKQVRPIISQFPISDSKIDHHSLDYQILSKLIWNVGSFIRHNIAILKSYDRSILNNRIVKRILSDDAYYDKINRYTIGFLSHLGYTLVIRSLDPSKTRFRYTSITWKPFYQSIIQYADNLSRYRNLSKYNPYLLRSRDWFILRSDNINKLISNNTIFPLRQILLVLAEGIFDIIGLAKMFESEFLKRGFDHIIYIASGKSYKQAIQWIRTFLTIPIISNIAIYFDNDTSTGFQTSLIKHIQKANICTDIDGYKPIIQFKDPFDVARYWVNIKKIYDPNRLFISI